MANFLNFSAFFAKQINKTHKITSYFYHMRKILTKKFWSQGTPLGSLGPLSQADVNLGFSRFQFLVIWGLNKHPMIVTYQGQAKSLKTAGGWCELEWILIFYSTAYKENKLKGLEVRALRLCIKIVRCFCFKKRPELIFCSKY